MVRSSCSWIWGREKEAPCSDFDGLSGSVLWPRSRCSSSRPGRADRGGTSEIGSAAKVGAENAEHRPNPSLKRRLAGQNPVDRRGQAIRSTPIVDRSYMEGSA